MTLHQRMMALTVAGLLAAPLCIGAADYQVVPGRMVPVAEPTMLDPTLAVPLMPHQGQFHLVPRPAPPALLITDGAPPPGTLGQTYQRPMKPIPVDKHPRVSIVDVRVVGATDVRVYGTNEYRTKDGVTGFRDRRDANLWHFESDPLTPGVPHIYRVEARFGTGPASPAQDRYFRFVPGRIVSLDF